MKTKKLKQLKEAGFSQQFIKILQGTPVTKDMTIGELFCLSELLPAERLEELLICEEVLSCDIIIKIFDGLDEPSDKTCREYMERLRKKATAFYDYMNIISIYDSMDPYDENRLEEYFEDFKKMVGKAENLEDCYTIFYNIVDDDNKEADIVFQKMREFKPSIDDWCKIQTEALTPYARKLAIKEIEAIAKTTNHFLDWFKVCVFWLDGSDIINNALNQIKALNVPLEEWIKLLKDKEKEEKWEDLNYRADKFVLKFIREHEGNFDSWLQLFHESSYMDIRFRYDGDNEKEKEELDTFKKMCFEKLYLTKKTQSDHEVLYELLKDIEDPRSVIVLKDIMTMLNQTN